MGEKLTQLVEKQETGSLKSLASFIPPAPYVICTRLRKHPHSQEWVGHKTVNSHKSHKNDDKNVYHKNDHKIGV